MYFLGMLGIYNDFRIRSFSLTEYIAIIKVWKNIGLYVCLCVPVGVSLYVCLSLINNSQRLTARFQLNFLKIILNVFSRALLCFSL